MGVAMGIMLCSIALTLVLIPMLVRSIANQAYSGLFGTPIAGELVKSGYVALSAFAGATMLVGAVLVLGARLSRNRNLLAKA
jgi:hypothetical protein